MARKHKRIVRSNNPKRSPTKDDEFSLLLSRFDLPKHDGQRAAVVTFLSCRRFLLSYLNEAFDELQSRFCDTNAYVSLEVVHGALNVVVRTDDGLSDYSMRLDAFEQEWATPALCAMNDVRFSVD